MKAQKFVTAEYHEGYSAYERGADITSNPYLKGGEAGRIWYWAWGWQDALAKDVRGIKQMILDVTGASAVPKGGMH